MGRKISKNVQLISCNVSQKARELLIAKSEQTSRTMSDLVDKLIVEAFAPKKGLAKRIKATIAKAEFDKDEQIRLLQSKLAQEQLLATQRYEEAGTRLAQEQLLATQRYEEASSSAANVANFVTSSAMDEWENSFQATLVNSLDFSGPMPNDLGPNKMLRWLFDRGIWCLCSYNATVKDSGLRSPRYFGIRMTKAILSIIDSPLFPDLAHAADLAADLPYEVLISTEALHIIMLQFDMSREAVYEAWCSDIGSDLYDKLMLAIQSADELLGTDNFAIARGC